MKKLFDKIIIILAIGCLAGILSALTNAFQPKSDPNQYKPYNFTDQDYAELTVTKFIKAIDNGNFRFASLLLDDESKHSEIYQVIDSLGTARQNEKNKRYLIIQLKEFVFNDSIGGGSMFCSIKNLNKPNEIRQSKIDVVKKEGRWLIASSSEFFKVFQGDKKKKSFQEKKDGIN